MDEETVQQKRRENEEQATEQREKFVIIYIQINMVQNNLTVKCFGDIFQLNDFFHAYLPKIKNTGDAIIHHL